MGRCGGCEIANAFLALGFELVVAFGEFGEDAKSFFVEFRFDEIGYRAGTELPRTLLRIRESDGFEKWREDADADGGVGSDVLDALQHRDPAGWFAGEFDEEPGREIFELVRDEAHEINDGVELFSIDEEGQLGDVKEKRGQIVVRDTEGRLGGLFEEVWVA